MNESQLEKVRANVNHGVRQLKQGQFTEYNSVNDLANSLKAEFRYKYEAEKQDKAKS